MSTVAPELYRATPQEAGLSAPKLEEIDRLIEMALAANRFPGAVVLIARNTMIGKLSAYGYALQYKAPQQLLPSSEWIPVRTDTIFDLASITKLFTALLAMQEVERNELALDRSVAEQLPEFGQNGKAGVTLRQLLTHTSGLPAIVPFYSLYETRQERINALLRLPLEAAPGSRYLYSDPNLMIVGLLLEQVTGLTLDTLLAQRVTGPLHLSETTFCPSAKKSARIAATEYEQWNDRGLVWGSVHDENAASLGGVAGHAGLFATAEELAVIGQLFLNHGSYGNVTLLQSEKINEMLSVQKPIFPGHEHGIGWELNQPWYMGTLASTQTAGHTGFTGTSLIVDRRFNLIVILLTNRVHPIRTADKINDIRAALATIAAEAIL